MQGIIPSRTADARKWFQAQAQQINTNPSTLLSNKGGTTFTTKIQLGQMYLFNYDPKFKQSLPYYDRFPLIFPFQRAPEGFLGINMHYLPHSYRAMLMDGLWDLASNDKMDETTRIQLSYEILSSASKYKYFKPCVKHYLNAHIRSRFLVVNAQQWDIALFLPLERFAKASTQQVFTDSIRKIKGR